MAKSTTVCEIAARVVLLSAVTSTYAVKAEDDYPDCIAVPVHAGETIGPGLVSKITPGL